MFFYDFTTSHILFVSGYNTKCYFPINISIIEYKLLLRLRFHVCNIPVQSALHKENSRFAAPTLGRHISMFRAYQILFSLRNPYINRFTNHFSIHS
jgi:hypothetical protein